MAAILKAISDLNVSPFEAAMGRMEKRVDKFASGNMAQLGRSIGAAFSVYAVARFAASTGAAADEIMNISDATGVGVENLQAMNVLFTEGGKSAADVSTVFARLRKSMDEATDNEKIAQAFQKLGISFQDVANQSPERIFEMISVAMRENAGDAEAGAAAGEVLGRSYAELQGIMNTLATQGLDPLREGLKSTNQIMGEESVKAADKMQEAYDKIKRQATTGLQTALVKTVQGLGNVKKAFQAAAMYAGGASSEEVANELWGQPEVYDHATASAGAAAEQARRDASAAKMAQTANKTRDAEEQRKRDKEAADAAREAEKQRRAIEARDQAIARANEQFSTGMRGITVSGVTPADSLARMGAYMGGQSSPAAMIAERQLKVAELQAQLQKSIEQATSKTAMYSEKTVELLED